MFNIITILIRTFLGPIFVIGSFNHDDLYNSFQSFSLFVVEVSTLNSSLVFGRVDRDKHQGNYSCDARNALGTGKSNVFFLSVQSEFFLFPRSPRFDWWNEHTLPICSCHFCPTLRVAVRPLFTVHSPPSTDHPAFHSHHQPNHLSVSSHHHQHLLLRLLCPGNHRFRHTRKLSPFQKRVISFISLLLNHGKLSHLL